MKALDLDGMSKQWAKLTLEGLRCDAALEATGISYRAFRPEGGKRMYVVLCVTGHDQIEGLRTAMGAMAPPEVGEPEDWDSISLADLVVRTSKRPGAFLCEPLRNSGKQWMALVFSAAGPDSIRMVEEMFELGS